MSLRFLAGAACSCYRAASNSSALLNLNMAYWCLILSRRAWQGPRGTIGLPAVAAAID